MAQGNQPARIVRATLERGAVSLYTRPAYYDKVYRSRTTDVGYYVGVLAAQPGPVLELGAGSGRVTLALARSGIKVTAVDASERMLASLQTRLSCEPRDVQRRVTIVHGDMRDVELGTTFSRVIAPFNTVLHLYTLEDVAGFFGTVKRHLRPRGTLVFDYATPRVRDLSVNPEKWYKGGTVIDPDSKRRVRYAERFHYSPQRQVLSTWLQFSPVDGTEPWELLLTHRQFFPLEMRALLASHGFTEQTWTSDFTDAAPSATSDVLVVHAQLTSGRKAGHKNATIDRGAHV